MLKLCELFLSLQGETSLAGFPSVFVRLSGCNLRCRYCDTRYAWEGGEEVTVEEVLSRVEKLAGNSVSLVALTGGEPLLQKETPRLLKEILARGYRALLETNGSLSIAGLPRGVKIILDVKTPGSGEEENFLAENLSHLKPGDELKFVLTSDDDYDWAVDFCRRAKLFDGMVVNFSPAAGLYQPARLAERIIADRLPARLNLQLHRILWPGRERGV